MLRLQKSFYQLLKSSSSFIRCKKRFCSSNQAIISRYEGIRDKLQSEPKQSLNYSLGSVYGAFLGDSIGAFVEFQEKVTEADCDEAIEMRAGGTHATAPGQLTDDSELALSQAYGLVEGKGYLNLDQIAYSYSDWFNSSPFDVGDTTQKALSDMTLAVLRRRIRGIQDSEIIENLSIEHSYVSTNQKNQKSVSNGSLMKITPLCVWGHRLVLKDLELAVALELSLTHSNHTIHQAGVCYALAIGYLINYPGDCDGALRAVELYIKSLGDKVESHEIQNWWQTVKRNEYITATENSGWLKIGWTYAFLALQKKQMDFVSVIREVIIRGGDTDTNAAIVGGLIGAAIGFDKLPDQQMRTMLQCDFTQGRDRPEKYHPRNAIDLITKIHSMAPKTLKVIPDLRKIKESPFCSICKNLL